MAMTVYLSLLILTEFPNTRLGRTLILTLESPLKVIIGGIFVDLQLQGVVQEGEEEVDYALIKVLSQRLLKT
jgi:hypothetical protein